MNETISDKSRIAPWSGFSPLIRAGKTVTHSDLTKAYGRGAVLTIRCDLSKLGQSEQEPHFSVTADVYTDASRRRNDIEAGGCLHDEALEFWPECAPLVALHLSDWTGQPMHALDNGWYSLAAFFGTSDRYHAGNSKRNINGEYREPTPEECLGFFANHVRLPIEQARDLAEGMRSAAGQVKAPCEYCGGSGQRDGLLCINCAGDGLRSWRDRLRDQWSIERMKMVPRWADEARAGIAWLWANATPSDQRREWRERMRVYLGIELEA